jgi:hypothetical protein
MVERMSDTSEPRVMTPLSHNDRFRAALVLRQPKESAMNRVLLMTALALLALLAACDLPPQDPELAARDCEERARAAQGPTGTVSIGVNSDSGPFTAASIGVSSDYLQGRDPVAVYEQCVYQRTGALPIRSPRLN